MNTEPGTILKPRESESMTKQKQAGTNTEKFAHFTSNILIPPTWSLILIWVLAIKYGHSAGLIFAWGIVGSIFAAILPVLYVGWLQRHGKISHFHIPIRSERNAPYLLSLGLLIFAYFFLWILKAPSLLLAATLASVGNTFFIFIVNIFWKISAHMMGAAAPLVAFSFAFGKWVLPFFLLLVLIGWSRVRLKAHTLAQVIAGGLAGLFLTYIQLVFYLKWL